MIMNIEAGRGIQEIVNVNAPKDLEKGRIRWKNIVKWGLIGAGLGVLLLGSPLAIAAGGLTGGAVGFWRR